MPWGRFNKSCQKRMWLCKRFWPRLGGAKVHEKRGREKLQIMEDSALGPSGAFNEFNRLNTRRTLCVKAYSLCEGM
jgi:hypothetical protein